MKNLFKYITLGLMRTFGRTFYKNEGYQLGDREFTNGDRLRLLVILNHTSLIEPIYISCLPWSFLTNVASRGVYPGADITLKRPIVGRLFKAMAPKVIAISRNRDSTWDNFLSEIRKNSLMMIIPEGRMKRLDGLDKHGKPMTVRGGVADILSEINSGDMLVLYSSGLHHVQSPGSGFPKLFKRLTMGYEFLDVADYKKALGNYSNPIEFSALVRKDLETRRDVYCPALEEVRLGKRQASGIPSIPKCSPTV